ncbi:MAG: UbiD family decarboxylase [Planctomycetes bacterium]|nr:UbiD family decarboxylase [Planctomycetota bacterium]
MSGPFASLRDYLSHLEAAGGLRRVECAVDKDRELACIARWAMEGTPEEEQYALRFGNVTGYRTPVVVNVYANHARYAEVLDVGVERLLERWAEAMAGPHPPHRVDSAPVFEVCDTEPDLTTLPIPVWTPGRDAGPYLSSAVVITKDPQTGVQNLATYRIQVQSPRRAGVFFGSRLQHGALHHSAWTKLGRPTPVALALGVPPAVHFAAAAKTAPGIDEMTIAGGLTGAPIDVVQARTVDLVVPAQAEYVIEGFIPPAAEQMEGPFGEALGYMNEAAPAPYMDLTCICHRADPIFHGYVQQLPPSDGHIVMEIGVLGPLWYYLTRKLKLKGIRDMAIAPGSAGVAWLIVQIEAGRSAEADSIGRVLARLNFGQKYILLVDEDIDIRDPHTLNWAISARVDPHRDITLIDDVKTWQLDPAVMRRAAGLGVVEPPYICSMAVVNATVRCPVPEISLPSRQLMDKALERWPETRLPPIRPRQRIRRLLNTHGDSG